ncbi:MAG: DNA-directed RNA polymerase subunit omega [Pyrinomonadaceae bacterium]|nr:DNA-directed RNA polymerase subunit omega [Blastocatellia bacterium]MCW5957483.1 DNA-directed RNA polymerase subunit omega [Pyrinomonadaceae bacterium]
MAQEPAEALEGNEETEEIIDPPTIDSKYRMILLAAQRSKQLQRGAIPRTELDIRKHKATRVAMRELEEKKVNFKILDN